MFRNLLKLNGNYQSRFLSAKSAPLLQTKKESRLMLISSKRKEFNFYTNQLPGPGNEKKTKEFGELPLASKGWRNRRSVNDFFTIHPTIEEEEAYRRLKSVAELKSLGLPEDVLENLKNEFEIDKLTKIQEEGIPQILNLNHVLIAAETGCGKTIAYLAPIISEIIKRKSKPKDMNTPLALILTPGRELATQISTVAEKLGKGYNIKVKTILGGSTKQKMMNPEFEEIDILVGSIGAISKLTTTGIYRMQEVRHVVLDEADTLLDDSFSNKLCYFLRNFPFHKNHLQSDQIVGTQLILASATMPKNFQELLQKVIDTETIHQVVSPNLHRLMPHVQQKFMRMNKSERPSTLLQIVKSELQKNRPLIIFGNRSVTSDYISIFLNNGGVNCVNLNGDMLMKIRMGQFEKFQSGEVDVLATTDVGSRGLDTTRARHVINFDFPLHVADYIHRCGRIGRVGNKSKCLVTNFVSSQREIEVVQRIEHAARTGGILPQVNANITNIIQNRILRDLKEEGVTLEKEDTSAF